jgi:hypothetical protein
MYIYTSDNNDGNVKMMMIEKTSRKEKETRKEKYG